MLPVKSFAAPDTSLPRFCGKINGAVMTSFVTTTYSVIRAAIVSRQQITCTYHGLERICCPHAIGWTGGLERVLMFQFAGMSSSGLPAGGEWRCMDVRGMENVRSRPGAWHSGPRHTRQQTCVKHVDIDITGH